MPPAFTDAERVASNLTSSEAFGFCRVFNKQQLTKACEGEWDGRWAIFVRHLKPQRFHTGADQNEAAEATSDLEGGAS